MKVLITGGGGFQGIALVNLLRHWGAEVDIRVTDILPENASKCMADSFIVTPRARDRDAYVSTIHEYIRREEIDVLVPATVHDIAILAELSEKLGCDVWVSDLALLRLFLRKDLTYSFLRENGFSVLAELDCDQLDANLPVIGKPIAGFGGRGIVKLTNPEDFNNFESEKDSFVWQPFLENASEFSIDVFFGKQGFTNPVVRRRERTTSGFAIVSNISGSVSFSNEVERLLSCLKDRGAYGFFNIQVLEDSSGHFFSDVNPRIGTSAAVEDIVDSGFDAVLNGTQNPDHVTVEKRVYRIIQNRRFTTRKLDLKAIAFDLDDTLLDHKAWVIKQFESFLSGFTSLKDKQLDELRISGRILIEEARVRYFLDELLEAYPDLLPPREELIRLYRQARPSVGRLYPDVRTTLAKLRSRGFSLALLTDDPVTTQRAKLECTGLSSYFDEICFTAEFNRRKPDRESFETLANRLDLNPSEIGYVGNHIYRDVYGALKANYAHAFLIARSGSFFNMSDHSSLPTPFSERYDKIANLSEINLYLNDE